MTLTQYPLDGYPSGTSITTGNTGANTISLGAGSTGVYSSAAAAYGAVGVRLSIAAGTSPAFRFLFGGGATGNQAAFRFCSSGPNGAAAGGVNAVNFVNFRHASGVVAAIGYDKGNNGLNFRNGPSGTIISAITFAALSTAAGSTVNLATILEYSLVVNNSTGAYALKVYLPGTSTIVWSASGTTTFTQTGAFAGLQFGGSSDVEVTQDVDFVQVNDGSSTEIAQPATNQPPTVSISSPLRDVAASSAVSFTATATDTDGTIAGYQWAVEYSSTGSNPTLTGATTATVSLTAPAAAGSLIVLRCTATDDADGTGYTLAEVRVPSPVASGIVPVDRTTGNSGWGIIGGAASQAAALGDGDAGTLVESPDVTSTASVRRFRLAPMSARSSMVITIGGALMTASGSHACKVRVGSGSTQVKEVSLPATTSSADYTVTLTAGEVAAITDWGAVWVELVAVL